MSKKEHNPRVAVLCVILAVILVFYSVRLATWQLAENDKYLAKVQYTTAAYTQIKAPRGEILDRYGRPFAINTDGYNVVFDASYFSTTDANNVILKLCNLLNSTGEKWNDRIPLNETAPYDFTDRGGMSVAVMLQEIGLNSYATAENCFSAMVEKYKLEGYTAEQQRIIMGVRLTMDVADFAPSIPFVFSDSISINTVTKIKEVSDSLPGVFCNVVANRQYVTGLYATHIIGNIGPIYAEEWAEIKNDGYSYDDYIGKLGIEKYAENYLRGTNGTRQVIRDSSGQVISSTVTKEPVSGNTVVMTLDLNLQEVCYNTLKDLIAKRSATETGAAADAGSIVVLDVNTGDTLAAVTYPSYDNETYKNNYESLLKDSRTPLFNRAFSGEYAPGSTFKPATAAIGLQLGKISSDETINCTHKYTYYNDYQPTCMGTHGRINVINALKVSCNFFFYELGRRIGITELNKYCKEFGLGVSTGIELNETKGILAGKDYRESIGTIWNDGDTLQAAIGQSDNVFSPLQLAVYTSTLANKGTRYRAHLIKEVRDYSLNNVVYETPIEALNKVDISSDIFSIVKKGMLSVTTEGSVSYIFNNYPVAVGGKTGTATVSIKGVEYNNAVFIAFAPYENPEIAVVIMAEKAGYGSTIAYAAESIFDAYFFYQGDTYSSGAVGQLLK